MRRYIVEGTWCEVMATFHTKAMNIEEAVQKFRMAFTSEQIAGLEIEVIDVEESNAFVQKLYKEGHKAFHGMYKYL